MRSAQGGILTAEWEISFGKSVGARETFSIEVKLMTGDGDRTEKIEPTMDFPRLHTVQRMNGKNTKVTPIDSITHNLSPDPAGETVRIGVRFERGTAPTIEVTKVN